MSRQLIVHHADPIGILARQLIVHHADPIGILALDEPGVSGCNNHYLLTGFNANTNTSISDSFRGIANMSMLEIIFQNGHPIDVGVNGITIEALLEVILDRMDGFQKGNDPCTENRQAFELIQKGLAILHSRADKRTEQIVIVPNPTIE
jgi:hypothetical protein